jgi:hypothetical protein
MPTKTRPPSLTQNVSGDNNIVIGGDVNGVVIAGDNNTVNQTVIQKFFNIFRSDAETAEQRNRRILLNHMENAWIKGVLDASLHGAAMLELGIKEDPEAVTKTEYPWAIKKEATDETLPAGTSMLEIFQAIGMGRSLLILGAPGSGKTTTLLELARQLIVHAREDVIEPIPVVFNLASWTEKLSLADWLAKELNVIYYVPRKVASTWVKENKMLLLLDGLDEVREESRGKCVDAINKFRKENGLTSTVVCSRSQNYADLKEKLSFEGAIEVQPLTQGQIVEFFNHFGAEMAGIKQALEKDTGLRAMAETPLFLSIMLMAYRDKQDVEFLVSRDEKTQRKYLFEIYIERMFERRTGNTAFKRQDVLHWLSWLAQKIIEKRLSIFYLEGVKRDWLRNRGQRILHRLFIGLMGGIFYGLSLGWTVGFYTWLILTFINAENPIETVKWSSKKILLLRDRLYKGINVSWPWLLFTILMCVISAINSNGLSESLSVSLFVLMLFLIFVVPEFIFFGGLEFGELDTKVSPNQGTRRSIKYSVVFGFWGALIFWTVAIPFANYFAIGSRSELIADVTTTGLLVWSFFGLIVGGAFVISHYLLLFILFIERRIPWNYVSFLDHCVDLIFLRRVGGGYIFVHRLLMEHIAAMYPEDK